LEKRVKEKKGLGRRGPIGGLGHQKGEPTIWVTRGKKNESLKRQGVPREDSQGGQRGRGIFRKGASSLQNENSREPGQDLWNVDEKRR